MRDFVQQQCKAKQYDEFLQHKVATARASLDSGRGRPNDDVEAEFSARRSKT